MNIKHILISAICLTTSFIGLRAAGPDHVPFIDTRRPDNFVELDIHAGVGAYSMLQNYGSAVPDCADFTLTPGALTQIGAGAVLPIRGFFAVGTGIDFNINNFYYSMTVLHPAAGTLNTLYTRNHFYSFDVPLFLSFRFNLGTKVRWDNELGSYLTFGVGGHTKTTAYTSSTNELGQSQVSEVHYDRDYYNDDDAIINGVAKLDWGLHLGTGIVVNRNFMLKCVMHLGAHDLAKNFGVLSVHNHTLNLTFKAGWVF